MRKWKGDDGASHSDGCGKFRNDLKVFGSKREPEPLRYAHNEDPWTKDKGIIYLPKVSHGKSTVLRILFERQCHRLNMTV